MRSTMRTRPTETNEGSSDLTRLFQEATFDLLKTTKWNEKISEKTQIEEKEQQSNISCSTISLRSKAYSVILQIYHPVDVDTTLNQM